MRVNTAPQLAAWTRRIQAIAQAGLTYGKDAFDLERYKELQSIAAELTAMYTVNTAREIEAIFTLESGYPTPKIDVRAAVFDQGGRVLLVRETSDGRWALPGGWADVGESVSEAAAREVAEETGYHVTPIKLLGLLDREKHPHPPMFWHVYKVFVQCALTSGHPAASLETDAVGFFARDDIPQLSVARVTETQMARMFAHYDDPQLPADFD